MHDERMDFPGDLCCDTYNELNKTHLELLQLLRDDEFLRSYCYLKEVIL